MDVNKEQRTGSRSALQEKPESNVGRTQPGNPSSSSNAATIHSANQKVGINKRNSKLNIPAAFLADKQEPAMNRPPIPKKVVANPVEDTKPSFTPKPALKPARLPTDKEGSVATILRTIKNAENRAHENGDVTNSEDSETTKSKPLNPFLANDLKNKSEINKPATPPKAPKPDSEKPVPPWKAAKTVESEKPAPPWKAPAKEPDPAKPVPAWKRKPSIDQKDEENTSNKSENVPLWKAQLESKKSAVETNKVTEEKPIPLWKQKNLQNKPEPLSKPEPSKTDSKDENKPPPVSRLKSSPFLANQSELNKAIGGLRRTSSSSEKSDEPPPVLRNLKTKKSIVRKSITRQFDQKKFYAVDIKTIEVDITPPPKPTKLPVVTNIDSIVEEYKSRLNTTTEDEPEPPPEAEEELEVDELYEELPEEPVSRRPGTTTQGRASKAVSLIPEMASDEEDEGEEYADTANVASPPQVDLSSLPPPPPSIPARGRPPPPPPSTPSVSADNEVEQEEYQDAEAGGIEEEGLEQDDVYEPLDDIQEEMDRKEEEERKRQQEEKRLEKERKEKEEKNKKEEQKRMKEEKKRQEEEKKKFEKEMKALKKKFNIQRSDLDNPQGEGNIMEDEKGSKNSLEVKKGMRVQIIRITDNPKGKWLVKLAATGIVGYVESSNVIMDNNLIKSVMAGDYMNSMSLPPPPPELLMDDQEEYADAEIGEPDELYEAV